MITHTRAFRFFSSFLLLPPLKQVLVLHPYQAGKQFESSRSYLARISHGG